MIGVAEQKRDHIRSWREEGLIIEAKGVTEATPLVETLLNVDVHGRAAISPDRVVVNGIEPIDQIRTQIDALSTIRQLVPTQDYVIRAIDVDVDPLHCRISDLERTQCIRRVELLFQRRWTRAYLPTDGDRIRSDVDTGVIGF